MDNSENTMSKTVPPPDLILEVDDYQRAQKHRFSPSFPLSDGRRLQLNMGEESWANFRAMILQMDADDATEALIPESVPPPPVNMDFAFPSTGDPEKDAEIVQQHIQSTNRINEWLCPNGCGPMNRVDDNNQECPKCGFGHFKQKIFYK